MLDFLFVWNSDANHQKQAHQLLNVYSQRATNQLVDKAKAFRSAANYTGPEPREFVPLDKRC